ncbi:MAG TPA: NAD(+) diphosphatase [Rhodocyclaceae bacterium]|nr:NAD(+) diphosphatase [Rhodocyclaceae bacterium]
MNEPGYWILRQGHQLLVAGGREGGGPFPFGTPADVGAPAAPLRIGDWRGRPCYAEDIDGLPAVPAGELLSLRGLFGVGGAEAFALAGRGFQLLDWQRNHRHCGRCGRPTSRQAGEFAMTCAPCGLVFYPRISPAVMVLVRRGEELLLARSPRFRGGVFSALAGFVEAGETLEQCAAREVREEVGLEIANLRYFASQPWPFPDSLMVAFFADYAGGTLTPDPREIEDARWFAPKALPELPDPVSIARRLIDAALAASGSPASPGSGCSDAAPGSW